MYLLNREDYDVLEDQVDVEENGGSMMKKKYVFILL